MRELWLKIAHAGAARVYSVGAMFLMLVVTARWLGPEGRGQLAAVTTWVGMFGTFASFSLGQVSIHRAAARREEPWIRDVFPALIAVTVAVSVAGWAIAAGLFATTNVYGAIPGHLLALAFVMLPFLVWEQYGSALLTAIDRLDIYNNRQIIGRTAGVVAVVAMAASRWPVAGALAAMVMTQVIVGSAGLKHLLSVAPWRPVRASVVRDLMHGGIQLHLNAIGSYLVMSTDVLIINYYRGPSETAYYQLAAQLVNTILVLPQAASVVVYGAIARRGVDAAWEQHRAVLIGVTGAVAVIGLVAAAAAPVLVPLVMGPAFTPAVAPFRWLLLAAVGMSFSTLMAPQWIGRGLFLQASVLTIVLGLMNLAISLIWVPRYGMYASVLGTVVTYAVAVIVNGGMVVHCDRAVRRSGGVPAADIGGV